MAIHERTTDRLIGTCAFSQLDGDNGSALYHITIGESDAWGHGFGTEATQLMLDHAFGTLGLHRIALFVFEFNERAIRAYRRCGYIVEGRSRESIFRDGRWWDELAMSVLESDWRAAHGLEPVVPSPPVAVAAAGDPSPHERVAVGTSDRLRRTLERWR
jgi:RimJ/RimL family protein N-acetyltransferase